jgi:membrane-bound lytic murein transglycosylase D
MTSFEVFKFYLSLNLGIGLSGILAMLLLQHREKFGIFVQAKWALRSVYFCICCSVIAPLAFLILPRPGIWQPMTQIWSGSSAKDFAAFDFANIDTSRVLVSLGNLSPDSFSFGWLWTTAVAVSIGSLIFLTYILIDLARLRSIMRHSLCLRRIGSVEIRMVPRKMAPFSFAYFGRAIIVVPEMLISQPVHLRISIKHEIQHHRQLDHWFCWPLLVIRALCWWNPLLWLLQNHLNEIQELACDEAVIGRRTSPHAYGRCLLWVARMTSSADQLPVGTAGFAGGTAAHKLRRRIESMLKHMDARTSRFGGIGLLAGTGLAIWLGLATASAGIQDRRITLADAERLAEKANSEAFPIRMNDLVLRELNRYLGTPDGRKFLTESIARLAEYEPMIQEYLTKYKLPRELLAVPLVESGYQNLPSNNRRGYGAGLWMFIAPTARVFGLRVENGIDQRLDVDLETDAAMRYLAGAKLQFNDWELALMAYNAGQGAIASGIEKHRTRDAWELIRAGVENDRNYLPKVIAVAIILANRDILN